jgi:S1-C subfamily serine protease
MLTANRVSTPWETESLQRKTTPLQEVAQAQDHDPLGDFVRQINDCRAVYSVPQRADRMPTNVFDACYYGHTFPNGRSRELATPVMRKGPNGAPTVQMERITTEGKTHDSQRLDVFVHALPSVGAVSWTDQTTGVRHGGTAFVVDKDGLAITDKHVVDGLPPNGSVQVKMRKPDGTEEVRTAHVVKVDAKQDLALLQLDKNQPGETFPALPLSTATYHDFRINEPYVELGNANNSIVMAKASFESLTNQGNLGRQFAGVNPDRSLYDVFAYTPHGFSGGPVMSVPGEENRGNYAVRGVMVYSDINKRTWVIPAPRAQELIDTYRHEQAGHK